MEAVEIKEGELVEKWKDEEGIKHIKSSTGSEFKIIRLYGRGAHGKVKECVSTESEKHFAIKSFNKLLLRKQKQYLKKKKGGMRIKTGLDMI